MTNAELIAKLERAKLLEEKAIPIYIEHLAIVLAWSSLDEKTEDTVKEYINIMVNESENHSKMFDIIINIINGQ